MSTGLAFAQFVLRKPPTCLSQLEAMTGRLHLDFAGHEGHGLVYRPRGSAELQGGLLVLSFRFAWDMYHQDPTKPRDVSLEHVEYTFDAPRAEVLASLEKQLGPGRDVVLPDARHREFGPFYIRLDTAAGDETTFTWERRRPEWAHPRVSDEARTALLTAVLPALIEAKDGNEALARLAGLVEPAGAKLSEHGRPSDGPTEFSLAFEPLLPLALMLDAFGWRDAVASSCDVHMSSWSVYPDPASRRATARVGTWSVEPQLTGWPRAVADAKLPELEAGPFPCYGLAGCVTPVRLILVTRRLF